MNKVPDSAECELAARILLAAYNGGGGDSRCNETGIADDVVLRYLVDYLRTKVHGSDSGPHLQFGPSAAA